MNVLVRAKVTSSCLRSSSSKLIRFIPSRIVHHHSRRPFSRPSFYYSDKSLQDEEAIASTMAPKPPVADQSIPWSTDNKPESTTKSTRTGKPVPLPSPSASVILVSPSGKVLLLHRVRTSSSFPSAHVFPGGNMEASDGSVSQDPSDPARHSDNAAYRTCAVRELFEESGILLARQSSSPTAPLLTLPKDIRLKGRDAIHSGKTTIQEWLASQSPSAVLDIDNLTPFTRWVTPTNVPKRFTTQMYIYFIPTGLDQEQKRSLIATGDEVETMAPEWRRASQWLDAAKGSDANKGIILFPPQYTLLSFVAQFLDKDGWETASRDEIEDRRAKLKAFITTDGSPPWSEKVISPTALAMMMPDGRRVLGLDKPGPELKGSGKKGDDTRVVLVRFNKEGPREVEVRWRKEVMDEVRESGKTESKL